MFLLRRSFYPEAKACGNSYMKIKNAIFIIHRLKPVAIHSGNTEFINQNNAYIFLSRG